MIDGEAGHAILDTVVALRMDALLDGDTITTTLIAACYSDAIRKGISPRQVAEDLRDGLPADFAWEAEAGVRDQITTAIEQYEEDIAA